MNYLQITQNGKLYGYLQYIRTTQNVGIDDRNIS